MGAGGHARVLLALILDLNLEIFGICDPELNANKVRNWHGLLVLGGDEALDGLDPKIYGLINGVGPMIGRKARRTVYEKFSPCFEFPPLMHRSAWVSPDAVLADGVQIMAGAIVQPGCSIGANTVINTRASVDHHSQIGPHSHIAPGAVICGGVKAEENVYVGAGATIIQNIALKRGSVIGAGTTCVRNVEEDTTVLGAAVRKLKMRR